jgi:Leucine carboxyl methyltransferase
MRIWASLSAARRSGLVFQPKVRGNSFMPITLICALGTAINKKWQPTRSGGYARSSQGRQGREDVLLVVRTRWFDDAVLAAVPASGAQVTELGAGLDTRPCRVPSRFRLARAHSSWIRKACSATRRGFLLGGQCRTARSEVPRASQTAHPLGWAVWKVKFCPERRRASHPNSGMRP